jgi:isopenicillin-N N-acyltransferase-like protein
MNRREFIAGAAGATLGMVLAHPACRPPSGGRKEVSAIPLLETSGTSYEVGFAIGRRFRRRIEEGLRRRREWFTELRSFMEQDLPSRYEPFVAAGSKYFPDVLEELRGWAEGSGVPFEDLMTLNLKAELAAMMHEAQPGAPGCSTLALAHADRLLLAHNEDGHRVYDDLMFLVRVSRPGKPSFLCLNYPGILSGNGPAMNSAGIVMTTNFIGGLAVTPGVPRYFLSRAALEATGLDEAIEVVTHPQRAFAFHYNIASRSEGKILSVETSVRRHAVHEVDGLYVHTNHLLLPGMEDSLQDTEYVGTSSMSRYSVLTARADRLRSRLEEVTGEVLVDMLSSHESAPYSPCRHPTDHVSGSTLACSLFDVAEGGLRLYASNPCGRVFETYGPSTPQSLTAVTR